MTIYGCLAVLFICLTIIGMILLLQWRPIRTEHHKIETYRTETTEPPVEQIPMGFAPPTPAKKPEKEEPKDVEELEQPEQSAMDTVIAAVNEMMGVSLMEDKNNGTAEQRK